MELKVSNGHDTTFPLLVVRYDFGYCAGGIVLKRVDRVSDLGVMWNCTLSPEVHMEKVVYRAYIILGFEFRSIRGFTSPRSLLVLYSVIVRPVLG